MSLRMKMTLWYALLTVMILAFVVGIMFYMSDQVAENQARSTLKSTVDTNADKVWNEFGELDSVFFETYKNGVYLQIYDDAGKLIKGYSPLSLSPESMKNEAFQEFTVNGSKVYFYSVQITEKSIEWPKKPDPDASPGWPAESESDDSPGRSTEPASDDFSTLPGSFRKETVPPQYVWVCGILPAESLDNVLSSVIRLTVIVLPAMMLLVALGGWLIASRSLSPVRKLTESAREISNGDDLSRRLDIGSGRDEIHTLADTFNDMFSRLEKSFNAEKQFTSDASHELRTPTAVILAECDTAKKMDENPEELKESITIIERQAKKMSALISRLLMFTRLDQGRQKTEQEDVNLSLLTEAVCEEQALLAERGIRVETDIQPDVHLTGDEQLLLSMIQNLVTNASKYGKDNGHIWVSLGADQDRACLTVRDDGIGMTKEQLTRIWDRFYQADQARTNRDGSMGLGLSMVHEIVKLHHGRIAAESEYDKGSTFAVILPVLSPK